MSNEEQQLRVDHKENSGHLQAASGTALRVVPQQCANKFPNCNRSLPASSRSMKCVSWVE
eukprot:1161159-Pelagomonas_calceolata.AAC.4